jgi:hypothetical protein
VIALGVPTHLNLRDRRRRLRGAPASHRTPALVDLCQRRFDGVNQGLIFAAFADLMLHHAADAGQESAPALEQKREEALRTPAVHFSPVGEETLLQSLRATSHDNPFRAYLAPSDTRYQAAHMYRKRADTADVRAAYDRVIATARTRPSTIAWCPKANSH